MISPTTVNLSGFLHVREYGRLKTISSFNRMTTVESSCDERLDEYACCTLDDPKISVFLPKDTPGGPS